MDELILFVYITAWLIATITFWRVRKSFDVGFYLLSLYTLLSVMSFFAYNSGRDNKLQDFSVLPLAYLFIMVLYTMSPVLRLNERRILYSISPNIVLINLIAWICIIPNLISFPATLSSLSEGITRLAFDISAGGEMYQENRDVAETTGHGIHNLTSILSNSFSGITILMTFYYATIKKKSRLVLSLLFVSCVVLAFGSVAQGTRGALVEYTLLMLFSYLLLKSLISPSIKRGVRIVGFSFLALATFALIILTLGRFGKEESGATDATAYYAGQQNLYFDKFAFDNNGIRYGDRTVPLFKRMLGFSNVPHNYIERRNKYPYLKINDEVFISYIGDFLLDFGPIIGSLLLVFQTMFVRRNTRLKKGKLYFHQIILLHFTIYMVSIGAIKLYPFSDVGGNLQIMVYTVIYVIFYFDYYQKVCLKTKGRIV